MQGVDLHFVDLAEFLKIGFDCLIIHLFGVDALEMDGPVLLDSVFAVNRDLDLLADALLADPEALEEIF